MNIFRLWVVGLLVALPGCAEILGFDQYSEGSGTTGGDAGSGGVSSASTGGAGGEVGGAGGAGGAVGGAGGAGGAAPEPECSEAVPCAPPEEPQCETVTCFAGFCVYQQELEGKLLAVQEPGDCKQIQCDGSGGAVEVDAVDPPDDNNPCLDHVCESGAVVEIPVAPDVPCRSGFCNGIGFCVGCLSPITCPGSDDECKVRTCVNETCGFNYTPNGTPVSSQTAGNCQQKQCDGNGNVKSAVDNGDTPSDDGNQCTNETCSGGVPTHPAKAIGAACGVGNKGCNAMGVCEAKGCTFFPGSGYGGTGLAVPAGTYYPDLANAQGSNYEDKLSSHQCTGGAQAHLWEHDDMNMYESGGDWTFDTAAPPLVPTYHPPANYGSLGDHASSLEVF